MVKTIAVLAGDGIGPEIVAAALTVLKAVEERFNHSFRLRHGLIGGAAWEKFGSHFPEETREICQGSDAILFGSVGGPVNQASLPKWHKCEANSILSLRKAFCFNLNLRPAKVYPTLKGICPLKDHIIDAGVDLIIVRELLGDIYFGEHKTEIISGIRQASDVATYQETQISAAAHAAFKLARERRKIVTSVDKSNVLDTSKLWRQVVQEVHTEYPDVSLTNMLVDNCAMQLVLTPGSFDVLLTSNLFGDILSDLAAVLPGSLGLTPSASLNRDGFAMYEPSGGSAPDLAGKDSANPLAQILCLALLLRLSFGLEHEATSIEAAVESVLADGFRCKDIWQHGCNLVGTSEMAAQVVRRIELNR